MKVTDDYRAKLALWAARPQVIAAPPPTKLPGFRSRKFTSHAEMNLWKQSLLRQQAHVAILRELQKLGKLH